MRGATMSLVRAWLIGIGAFALVTAAFCLALIIAIAGPPSPSEIAGFQLAAADTLRDLDAAGQRVRGKLCAYLPPEQREAASCEAGVAQSEPPAPAPAPRVIVANVEAAPPATTAAVAAETAAPRPAARAAASRRTHVARRASGGHRARPPANPSRRIALAGAHRRPPPPAAAAPPATTPHPLPELVAPPPEAPSAEPAATSAGDADALRGGAHAHASVADEILDDEPPPDSEDATLEDPPPDAPPLEPEDGVKK